MKTTFSGTATIDFRSDNQWGRQRRLAEQQNPNSVRGSEMHFIKTEKTANGQFHVTLDAVVTPERVQHLADVITELIEGLEREDA